MIKLMMQLLKFYNAINDVINDISCQNLIM